MIREPISSQEFTLRSISAWDDAWFLLTSGDFVKGQYNTMTVSWGSIGMIWSKPFAQVVVRPTRHTYGFIQTFPDFTLCAFDEEHREALRLLGTKSGRDFDKISSSNLTPIPSKKVNAPTFAEANLVIECRKVYQAPFNPEHFIDPDIEKCYSENDYHTCYYGEILSIEGDRSAYTR
jgi:flavin reductase (DIM6/NTAB) family NADH-FMN oxidoreductase RutF